MLRSSNISWCYCFNSITQMCLTSHWLGIFITKMCLTSHWLGIFLSQKCIWRHTDWVFLSQQCVRRQTDWVFFLSQKCVWRHTDWVFLSQKCVWRHTNCIFQHETHTVDTDNIPQWDQSENVQIINEVLFSCQIADCWGCFVVDPRVKMISICII